MTSAIVAIVLLLGLGWTLRHHVLTEPGFWRGLELLSYRVFTPALFVTTIGGTDLGPCRWPDSCSLSCRPSWSSPVSCWR